MRLLYKIAFRNLLRHKGRSLSIGCVLVVGAFFMTVGNGVISGMKNGMEQNLVKALFGDITLMSKDRLEDSLSGRADVLEFMKNYESVQKIVSGHTNVERITPVVFGKAAMLDLTMTQNMSSGIDTIGFWGMDFKNYSDVYSPSVVIIEGCPLRDGERGILINANLREYLYFMHDVWLLPECGTIVKDTLPPDALSKIENLKTRNDLVLLGLSGSVTATDVRVPIKGIFEFKQMNEVIGLTNDADINLVDIVTARNCMGYINPEEKITKLSPDNQNLLDRAANSPDNLFDNEDLLVKGLSEESAMDYAEALKQDSEELNAYTTDNRIYNISQVNLKPDADLDQAVEEINGSLIDSGLDKYVRAVSWRDAWADFSGFITRINLILKIFINIIFLAAVLMIANALSIATIERVTEISTMRTIGSQKGFIAWMFITETSLLTFFFGGLGMILGIATTRILAGMELTTTQPVLQIMYGGNQFSPFISMVDFFSEIIQLGVITVISVMYPLIITKNIKPIDAIRHN